MPKQFYIRPIDIAKNGFSITEVTDKESGSNNLLGKYSDVNAITSGAGSHNEIESDFVIINGKFNKVGPECSNVIISGNSNSIGGGASNISLINCNDCTVLAGVSNVNLIGVSGLMINRSNESYIYDQHFLNGKQVNSFEIIDGGLDTVEPLERDNQINIIDGGLDIVFVQFSDLPYDIIDGGFERVY